jgi:hypothetical protein
LELFTKYSDESPGSNDVIWEGFNADRRILDMELDEKMHSLVKPDDPWIANEMEKVKNDFISRLHQAIGLTET